MGNKFIYKVGYYVVLIREYLKDLITVRVEVPPPPPVKESVLVPLHGEQMVRELKSVFKPIAYSPTATEREWAESAGQQAVIRFIEDRLVQHVERKQGRQNGMVK